MLVRGGKVVRKEGDSAGREKRGRNREIEAEKGEKWKK